MVELALITPVLALVVLGTLDLTRCYRMQIRLENAAREGGAYAQVHPGEVTCEGDDDIVDRVVDEDEGLSALPGFVVAVTRDDASGDATVPVHGCRQVAFSPGDRVRVEATATYPIVTPLVQRAVGTHLTVTGSYEVVVQG
jgi:Flp pilus assembly protein TadG